LPSATQVEFKNYLDVNWSDVIADHTDAIGDTMVKFVERTELDLNLPPASLSPGEGEALGISYRIFGSGKPLVLLPLVLAPSQWEPLLHRLSKHYCTIVLGGAELGGVRQLEARGRTEGYRRVLQRFVNEFEITPGARMLEVGCGSGVLTRLLAESTQRANPIVALDVNRYFLSEASVLAKRQGYGDIIEFREGGAEALPFPDIAFDFTVSATVMEEVDADRMLAEMIRVTKPGGRIGVMVRAEDIKSVVNIPLRAELKAKIESPRGNVSAGGCADSSLYRRFYQAGLLSLKMFPQLASFSADGPHGERLIAGTVAALSAEEATEWHEALRSPEASELLFIARPFHCAVGTKPLKQ
ncbi:MAG TPA: methyltransferase domain-containing protein, partial [Candidatus Binatus sp.]|nr:methyltransferase domain-containing protein [Candidatus Binatus sp.]